MEPRRMCMTCCSDIQASGSQTRSQPLIHGCCGRLVCTKCIATNARLATFCPFCEDATSAFKKGRRNDVVHAGDTLFDVDKAIATEQGQDSELPPPDYAKIGSDFVIEDDTQDMDSIDVKGEKDKQAKYLGAPVQISSKSPSAPEVSVPRHSKSSSAEVTLPERIRIPPDVEKGNKSQALEDRLKSAQTEQETVQYWLRPQDSLSGLALRFNVPGGKLCSLNELPRSTLSTTPHILHTRRWILIPAASVAKAAESDPKVLEAISGPPKQSEASKISSARRGAEAKFRANLLRSYSGKEGETPPDERAARAYIALMEEELAWVDFGDLQSDDRNPARTKEEEERDEQLRDSGRVARYDAILSQAVARWMMDSDWERAQRAAGLDPASISHKSESSSSTSSNKLAQNFTSGFKSFANFFTSSGEPRDPAMDRPKRLAVKA